MVVPTHFIVEETTNEVLLHLARANPIWSILPKISKVCLAVVDDYAYIPSDWRESPEEQGRGVPTSYYAAVHMSGTFEVIDDGAAKAEILRKQMAIFQPQGGFEAVDVEASPYGRMLNAITGLRIRITDVEAKFKYDDHKSVGMRSEVQRFLRERADTRDAGALSQLSRRMLLTGKKN